MRTLQNSLAVAAVVLAAGLGTAGCGDSGSAPGPVELRLVSAYTGPAGLDVASSGDAFLVAYGGSAGIPGRPGTSDAGILGLRVATDGTVLDASSFRIADASDDQAIEDPSWTAPSVAFDGGSYVVAFAGSGTAEGGIPGTSISAVPVDPEANVGTQNDLVLTAGIGMCRSAVGPPPAVGASAGGALAVLFPLDLGCAGGPVIDRLSGVLATRTGSTIDDVTDIVDLLPPIDATPVVASAASVATSASATVATWTQGALGAIDASVVVAILTASGVERVTLATDGIGFVRPAIASDGGAFLVVWASQSGSIQGARFQPGSAPPEGPAGFTIAAGPGNASPRVAFGGGQYMVVWTSSSNGDVALASARVSSGGDVGPSTTLATGLASASISIAAAGDVFLVPFQRAANADTTSLRAMLIEP